MDEGRSVRERLQKLVRDARGATAIEYALILAVLSLAIIGAAQRLVGPTNGMWNTIQSNVLAAAN